MAKAPTAKPKKVPTPKATEGGPTSVPLADGSKKYEDLKVVLHTRESKAGPITPDLVRKLMGVREEESKEKPLSDNDVWMVLGGKKFAADFNRSNRIYNHSLAERYAQDILQGNWADSRNGTPDDPTTINGETMVFDWNGQCQSAQHRFGGLLIAESRWADEKEGPHWKERWPDGPPTMEGIIVYGISPSPRVIRTLDNVRPRTFADTLYTKIKASPDEYKALNGLKKSQLAGFTKVVEFSIRNLWERLGLKHNPYGPERTNSEQMEFLERHPRVMRMAQHVFMEDDDGKISKYVSPGAAVALGYLFAASGSDGTKYHEQAQPTEALIEWGADDRNWERACEFWVFLKDTGVAEFAGVREAIAVLADVTTGKTATKDEKVGVLVKAWGRWTANPKQTLTAADLKLTYSQPEPGDDPVLAEIPTVEGIDLGKPEPPVDPNAPTKEEIEAKKAKIKEEKEKKKADKEKAKAEKQAAKGTGGSPVNEIAQSVYDAEVQFPDRLICFKGPTGYSLFDCDPATGAPVKVQHAKVAKEAFDGHPEVGYKYAKHADGINRGWFPLEKLDEAAPLLRIKFGTVCSVEFSKESGKFVGTDLVKAKPPGRLFDDASPPEPTTEQPAVAPITPPVKKTPPQPKGPPALRGGTETPATVG